jgi:hypothetical protein
MNLAAFVITDQFGLSRCRLCGALGRAGIVKHGGRNALTPSCPLQETP